MNYTCPVCFYDQLDEPPTDYNICDCCGTEFGSDDEMRSHAELREFWISKGAKWFFRQPPPMWNPWQQLSIGGAKLPYTTTITYFNSIPFQSKPYFTGGLGDVSVYYGGVSAPIGGKDSVQYVGMPSVSTTPFVAKPLLSSALEGEFVDDVKGMAA